MLTTISPTAVAAHLHAVQSGLQLLYQSARTVYRMPGRFPPAEASRLRQMLERGAFESWRCEQLLSGISAANDAPARPVLA